MKDHMEYQQALGQVIRDRRVKRGFSPEKLARIIGAEVSYIAAVESGEGDMGLSEMILMARALGIPLSTLLALAEARLDC